MAFCKHEAIEHIAAEKIDVELAAEERFHRRIGFVANGMRAEYLGGSG